MQLSLMDLKLLKIGYMKKFIKKVGFILSIPLVWLLVIYNICLLYTSDAADD